MCPGPSARLSTVLLFRPPFGADIFAGIHWVFPFLE
jgi:hypothetical protein